jgi:hypothetical protein
MIRAQSCQHGESVKTRQINVQNDQVRRIFQSGLEAIGAIVARGRFVIGPLQLSRDLPGEPYIILDYKHTHVFSVAEIRFQINPNKSNLHPRAKKGEGGVPASELTL